MRNTSKEVIHIEPEMSARSEKFSANIFNIKQHPKYQVLKKCDFLLANYFFSKNISEYII